jgi:hypothetical protein
MGMLLNIDNKVINGYLSNFSCLFGQFFNKLLLFSVLVVFSAMVIVGIMASFV